MDSLFGFSTNPFTMVSKKKGMKIALPYPPCSRSWVDQRKVLLRNERETLKSFVEDSMNEIVKMENDGIVKMAMGEMIARIKVFLSINNI